MVPAYAASEGGIAQLTKALSNEWAGKGVCVNTIAPGYIASKMNSALMTDGDRATSILSRLHACRWSLPDDFEGPVGSAVCHEEDFGSRWELDGTMG